MTKEKQLNKKQKVNIFLILTFLLIIIPALITYFTHNYHFGKRIYHNNNYYEYLQELNQNFIRDEVGFKNQDNITLGGAFHYQKNITNPKALLIWVC